MWSDLNQRIKILAQCFVITQQIKPVTKQVLIVHLIKNQKQYICYYTPFWQSYLNQGNYDKNYQTTNQMKVLQNIKTVWSTTYTSGHIPIKIPILLKQKSSAAQELSPFITDTENCTFQLLSYSLWLKCTAFWKCK